MRWLASVILAVALTVACGQSTTNASHKPSPVAPSPSSNLDPAVRAYLAVIQADGTAYEEAHNAGIPSMRIHGGCNPGIPAPTSPNCAALNVAVTQALQKLAVDLDNVQAPARWAISDQAVRANLPTAISALQAVAKAYNEGNGPAYSAAVDSYLTAASPIQSALTDIDPSLSFD